MDKFNDMWKNRFNEGDMPVADWNTPGDEVWDAILPHVVEEKKKHLAWWIVLLLGGTVILFLALKAGQNRGLQLGAFPINMPSILEVTTYSSKTDNLISTSSSLAVNEMIEGQRNQATDYKQTSQKDVLVQKDTADILTNKQPVILINRETNKLITSDKVSRIEEMLGNDKKEDISKLEIVPKTNTLAAIDLLPVLSFKLNSPSQLLDEISNVIPVIPYSKVKDKKEKISVGMAAGVLFWNHSISGAYQNDLAPFDFNYTNNVGSFINAQIDIPISSQWRLYTGIQMEQVTTTSGHNSSIEYNKNLETTDSNNDYDLGLATPYGISAANFVLDRDITQPIVDDTVPLLVDFHSDHEIKNISIPVGIEMTPWGKNKSITPSFRIGGGVNYITQITNNLAAIDTHHGAISFDKEASMDFEAPTIETLFFDIQLGLRTSISVSKSIQFQVEYMWKKGLNPIFKQSDYNTTINRHFLSAGLSKTLGK